MKEQKKIDPRIVGVATSVLHRLGEHVIAALQDQNLIDESGYAISPLTQSGFYQLAFALGAVNKEVFLQTDLSQVPSNGLVEEIGLSDSIVVGFGKVEVEVKERTFCLKFTGDEALIQEIDGLPLDKQLADYKNLDESLRVTYGPTIRIVPKKNAS